MTCKDCIRAQRTVDKNGKQRRLCKKHAIAETARQQNLRSRRKAEARCRCGKELPDLFVTPLGRPALKECIDCTFKRGARELKPLVVSGGAEGLKLVTARRGKARPAKVFEDAQRWREQIKSGETIFTAEGQRFAVRNANGRMTLTVLLGSDS